MSRSEVAEPPAVSVVLTVFDKARALPETLARLRSQTGPRAEIVCVDDASRDGSVALLRAEAAADPMLVLMENDRNLGPAIRLNQGARRARGRWLHLIDADDLAAPNAQAWMLGRLDAHRAALIYGRRRKGTDPAPIPDDAPVRDIADALAFCAARPVAHMAVMVERDLFLAAGGADPSVFIQDQSLPLRLAARAGRMLWTDETICEAPPETGPRLSGNRLQQNHDRFLSALHALHREHGTPAAKRALRRLCASALFKIERELGARTLRATLDYALAKLGAPPSAERLTRALPSLALLDSVRRPPLDAIAEEQAALLRAGAGK